MALPKIAADTPITVPLEPLTPSSFAPFGTVITSPLPPSPSPETQSSHAQETIPTTPPAPRYPTQPTPIFANQKTALKTSPISPLINDYPPAFAATVTTTTTTHPSPTTTSPKPSSRPLISLFSCFPRPTSTLSSGKLPISILERHPYTTQTFSPLALPSPSTKTCYIVIVTSSLSSQSSPSTSPSPSTPSPTTLQRPPNLSSMRAFLARGDQAITYGVATWHAPMIVLGSNRIDFVVTQFVNGVPEDDCQEVCVEGVDVELAGIPRGIETSRSVAGDQRATDIGSARAKL